jgi:hypothetical protein
MKNCPVCKTELAELELAKNTRSFFICNEDSHGPGIQYESSYLKATDQLLYYRLRVDRYSVESMYETNKTHISQLKEVPGFEPKFETILYLPLIHFELDNVDEVKKKLKLILLML